MHINFLILNTFSSQYPNQPQLSKASAAPGWAAAADCSASEMA